MKEKGQIRYIGITHYTTGALAELARILESEPGIDFVQCGYSLATRDAETAAVAGRRRAQGRGHRQPAVRRRRRLFRQVRGRALPEWAAEFDCASWAQLFLKYIFADPAVTCAIPAHAPTRRIWPTISRPASAACPTRSSAQQIRQLWDAL